MHFSLIGHQAHLARTLALAALLLFSAAQVHEAAHSHAVQDSGSHCLLCKQSSDTAAAVAQAPDVLLRVFITPTIQGTRPALAPLPSYLFARGPPTLS